MKKTIDYYMKLPYKKEVHKDPDEGGFVISFPELPGCLTIGETLDDAWNNSEDAKHAWLSAALEDGIQIMEPRDTDSYSGQFKLRLPKSLHKQLAEQALIEGISMNQYCLYLLAQNSQKKTL